MSQYLRDVAVRAVSQFLAEYVEGITAEQAQLTIRDGRLELPGAVLKDGIVPASAPFRLERGEISLSLIVPWRRLGQEPVVIEVSKLVVELEPEGVPSSKSVLIERWRRAREAAVEAKARALAAADATQKGDASIFARITKRVLQNLEVKVNNARLIIKDRLETLELNASLVLQTMAGLDAGMPLPQTRSSPAIAPSAAGNLEATPMQCVATPDSVSSGTSISSNARLNKGGGVFFKSFELTRIEVHLNRSRLLGPLSLRTKLSDVDSVVCLQIELINTEFSGRLAQLARLIGMMSRLSQTANERSAIFPKLRRNVRGSHINTHEPETGWFGPRGLKSLGGASAAIDTEGDNCESEDERDDSASDENTDDESEDDDDDDGIDAYEAEYTSLLLIRLSHENLDEEQVSRMREIEDTADVTWLAWRLHACEKQLAERRHDASSGTWPWLSSLFQGSTTRTSRLDVDRDTLQHDIRSLLRELPEDEAPETLEILVSIPSLDLFLRDDQSDEMSVSGEALSGSIRGLEVRAHAKPQGAQRSASLVAELVSANLKFAETPLMRMDSLLDDAADENGFCDVPGAAIQLQAAAREDANGWLVTVDLLAPPSGCGANINVSNGYWPFEVILAPWSIRRFLELYLIATEAAQAYSSDRNDPCSPARSQRKMTKRRTISFTPSGNRRLLSETLGNSPTADQSVTAREALDAAQDALPTLRFELNMRVAAPALHWDLPSGDRISFCLGQVFVSTKPRTPQADGQVSTDFFPVVAAPSPHPLSDLHLEAELSQMCVTILHRVQRAKYRIEKSTEDDEQKNVYSMFEPSTMIAHIRVDNGTAHAELEAASIKMRGGREVWRFFGQLQPTLAWALEPLTTKRWNTRRRPISKSSPKAQTTSADGRPSNTPRRRSLVPEDAQSNAIIDTTHPPFVFPPPSEDGVFVPPSSDDCAVLLATSSDNVGHQAHEFIRQESSGLETSGDLKDSAESQAEVDSRGGSAEHPAVALARYPSDSPSAEGIAEEDRVYASDEEALRSFLGVSSTKQSAPSQNPKMSKGKSDAPRIRFERALTLPVPSNSASTKAAKPRGLVLSAGVEVFEIFWGGADNGACLRFEQLGLRRVGAEATGRVASMNLTVRCPGRNGKEPAVATLLSTAGDGGCHLKVGTGGAEAKAPWLKAHSAPICADWKPECAAPILRVVMDTRQAWAEGQRRVEQQLCIREGSKGTIAESWRRWRETHLKGWRRKLLKRMKRLRMQFPDPARNLHELGAKDYALPVEDRLPPCKEEEATLEAAVCLESLSLGFWAAPAEDDRRSSPCIKTELGRVNISASLFQSCTVRGRAALQGFEVHLHDRRILVPRRAAEVVASGMYTPRMARGIPGSDALTRQGSLEHLLEIGFHIGERTLIAANGAQLSLLYRQRDVDFLIAYCHAQVLDVLADFRDTESPSPWNSKTRRQDEPHQATPRGESQSANRQGGEPQVLYSLDIGCPILFFPTFKAVLHGGDLGKAAASAAHDTAQGGRLGPEGNLHDLDDSYTMVDFGNLQVWNRSGDVACRAKDSSGIAAIELRFRGAVIKSNASGNLRYVARPTAHSGTTLTVLQRGHHVEASSTGHYCMELMRHEVSQWLDIIAENVLYKRYAPTPPPTWPLSTRQLTRIQQLQKVAREASTKIQTQGFVINWRWQALDVDTAFTEAAPLSHIELHGGRIKFQTRPFFAFELEAQTLTLLDRRPGSRNAERAFIRCGRLSRTGIATGGVGSGSETRSLSVIYQKGHAVVHIGTPVVIVLPQLFLDQQTWGLSVWRTCTWRRHPATAQQRLVRDSSAAETPKNPVTVDVHVEQGAFRILTQLEDRSAEHLEIRGNLHVKVGIGVSDGTELDVKLSDGRIYRSLSPTLLCPAVRLALHGNIGHGEQVGQSEFSFNLSLYPLRMQLTGLDLGILTRAFGELGRRDAESVEPREEIELRDPEALKKTAKIGMSVMGHFTIANLELLLADDRRGSQPALAVSARCPALELQFGKQRGQPSTWSLKCTKEALVLAVRSFHTQLGVWEPVISDWKLNLNYRQEPLQNVDREALVRQLEISSETALTAVVTTAGIRLLSWFVPRFIAHLDSKKPDESGFESPLSMLNLSGTSCSVSCRDVERIMVPPSPSATPLDEFLRPSENTSQTIPIGQLSRKETDAQEAATDMTLKVDGWSDKGKIKIEAEGWNELQMQLCRDDVASTGKLVCEVLSPHPSRQLLLLSSAVHVENCTQLTLEVRFLDQMGHGPVKLNSVNPVDVSVVRRHLKSRVAKARDYCDSSPDHAVMKRGDHANFMLNSSKWSPQDSVTLMPGQMLFAPFAAVHGTTARPRVKIQLRPSDAEHPYAWCAPAFVESDATESNMVLPCEGVRGHSQTLFMDVSQQERGHGNVTTLQLTVSCWSLANATPCFMECRLVRGRGVGASNSGAETGPGTIFIAPHQERSISGPAMNLQIRLQTSETFTDWSNALQMDAPGEVEDFDLVCSGAKVSLGLKREKRRVVVFASLWFVDATNLGAKLCVNGSPAVRFGETISLLPIKATRAPGAKHAQDELELEIAPKGHPPTKASVPALGATETVTLQPHCETVLRTERISVVETFGVACGLVSLLPKYVLFNLTRTSAMAFRQEGITNSIVEVGPEKQAMLFFAPGERKRLEFAPVGNTVWSPSFELADHTIGAYPIATNVGPVCLRISREGGVFSATVDPSGCHEVRNEHKSLVAEVRPDGDSDVAIMAQPGHTRFFASRAPFLRGTTATLHLTRLGGGPRIPGVAQTERLQIDLTRRERLELRVGGLPVTVIVATMKRVAVVTVRPREWTEAVVERIDCSVRLSALQIALVGDARGANPRCQHFGARLDWMELQVEQEKDEDMRAMSLTINKLQIDRLYPSPDVLLVSTDTRPFLKGHILREDCNSSHVLLSSGELRLGELEAAVDDETVRQVRAFVDEAIQEPPGLQLHQIRRRAIEPYPQSCEDGPPDLPPTFVLRSLVVFDWRLRVWARLSLVNSFLPKSVLWLTWLTRITGLGVSELQFDGAVFSVPQLRFFQYSCLFGRPDPPFVGSARGLLGRIAERYIPELTNCWKSVVSNSNIMFRGILSRQFWFPKNRKVSCTRGPLCRIVMGRIE